MIHACRLLWLLLCLCIAPVAEAAAPPLRALIVTGQMNKWHDAEATTPLLKRYLEQTDRFNADVLVSPPAGGPWDGFQPQFADYDVVVLNYDGELWPTRVRKAFEEYVQSGGGVVVYHAADNSFPEWKEYNRIIGLAGWGDRDEKDGPYKLSLVEMKLQGVNLEQLSGYLYRIETSPNMVAVKRLSVTKTGKAAEMLTAVLQVETLEI